MEKLAFSESPVQNFELLAIGIEYLDEKIVRGISLIAPAIVVGEGILFRENGSNVTPSILADANDDVFFHNVKIVTIWS
jgi:hypothetical protein